MGNDRKKGLCSYVEDFRKGEDILIEYHSEDPVHLVFYSLLQCIRDAGKHFIIIDEVDQLHVFRSHVELAGLPTNLIDMAPVVKIGGSIETGNVVGTVDPSKELPVRKRYYEEVLQKVSPPYAIRLVVGFDKILARYEDFAREREKFFKYMIRPHLNDKSRTTIYFVNTDLVSTTAIKEFREHATRALIVNADGESIRLKVVKSLQPAEYGMEIKV